MTTTKKGRKEKAKAEVIDPRFLPPPDLPEWIPAVADFWGKPTATGLEYSYQDTRKAWLEKHLSPVACRCFAAACASRSLHLFEQHNATELAPRNAIRVALQVNFGMDAARAAARAARAAARAADAAAYAADAADAADAAYAAYAADAASGLLLLLVN